MNYLINLAKHFNLLLSENSMSIIKKVIVLPLILSILATTAGCNSSSDKVVVEEELGNTPNDLSLLQSAKTKWESQSGQFYTIQSQRICECVPEMTSLMTISVSDDFVLSAFNLDSNTVISKEIQQEVKTVDSLFALIETAIADGVTIEVTYNEEFGYPETAKIDLEELAVDGGLFITLSDLEIKESLLALDNVTWILESFDSIAGPQPIIDNTILTLSIDMDNMQVFGSGGCNNFSADFVQDEKNQNMTISNIVSTEMACSEPENIMQQEHSYFATLGNIRFYASDKATLNMVVGGDSGLHFVANQYAIEVPIIGNPSNDLSLLQTAKKKWDSHSGQYYTIQSHRSCECEDEVSAQMEVSVLGDAVLSAINIASGEEISDAVKQEINTIDGLFALIEKAIADGVSIEVNYNEEYGYPEILKLDLEKIPVDGGLYITLSNLEIKDATLALDNVTWVLESFNSIAGPQPIIDNTTLTLAIDMVNMQVNGSGGCNNFSADLVINEKNHDMTISNVISTDMACSEPENIMQQEQSYFATLGNIRFFTFNQASLSLTVGADSGLHFVAGG
jgi:heat shock protein HslJ